MLPTYLPGARNCPRTTAHENRERLPPNDAGSKLPSETSRRAKDHPLPDCKHDQDTSGKTPPQPFAANRHKSSRGGASALAPCKRAAKSCLDLNCFSFVSANPTARSSRLIPKAFLLSPTPRPACSHPCHHRGLDRVCRRLCRPPSGQSAE